MSTCNRSLTRVQLETSTTAPKATQTNATKPAKAAGRAKQSRAPRATNTVQTATETVAEVVHTETTTDSQSRSHSDGPPDVVVQLSDEAGGGLAATIDPAVLIAATADDDEPVSLLGDAKKNLLNTLQAAQSTDQPAGTTTGAGVATKKRAAKELTAPQARGRGRSRSRGRSAPLVDAVAETNDDVTAAAVTGSGAMVDALGAITETADEQDTIAAPQPPTKRTRRAPAPRVKPEPQD